MDSWPDPADLWGKDWVQRADENIAARRRTIALEKQTPENPLGIPDLPSGHNIEEKTGGRWLPGSPRSVYGAKLALGAPPAPRFAVQGLFTAPSLNLLVGDPGHKKSLLALDLAIAVAMGKPWLGLPVTQSPTLLVEEETSLLPLWKRVHSALVPHNAIEDTPFFFISSGGYDFRLPSEAQDLIDHARALQAGLIVIDALANVMIGGDENSVLSMQPVFRNLRSVALNTGAAVVIVHHTNKTGLFRGSTSIAAGVDHMLAVYSPPGQPIIRVSTVKSRHVDAVTLHAEAHFENDQHWLTVSDQTFPESATSSLSPSALKILGFVAQHPGESSQVIIQKLRSLSSPAIRKILYDLAVLGLIDRTDGNSRGKVAHYKITPSGSERLSNLSKETSV